MAPVPRDKHFLGTPRGSKGRRGRPRKTGRRDLLVDTERMGITWNQGRGQGDTEGLSSIDSLYPGRGDRLK